MSKLEQIRFRSYKYVELLKRMPQLTISVDIGDRLYDYTDEEKAAAVVAEYQHITGIADEEVIKLWSDLTDSRRNELEKRIFDALDANGSAKRALESIPGDVSLVIDVDDGDFENE